MVTRYYAVPFRKGSSITTEGFDTAVAAGQAANDMLLNGGLDAGTSVAVVQLIGVVQLDTPVTKTTLAANL